MSKHLTLTAHDAAWLTETLARNRAQFGGWRMDAAEDAAKAAADKAAADAAAKAAEDAFTQADVDRIVADRLKREREATKAKYGDYDDLKKKAEGAKTVEDRVAEVERKAQESEARALRAEVANAKGLTASQAKRLIGSTKEELEADAEELLKDFEVSESERKKRGNRVPDEGKTTRKPGEDKLQEFSRTLFGRDD
jgi:hypothetical protein